jgi:hypothetical protein
MKTDKKEINFEDNRSRKIIYLGNCLLNQNIRFPGIGVCEGFSSSCDILKLQLKY